MLSSEEKSFLFVSSIKTVQVNSQGNYPIENLVKHQHVQTVIFE